MDIYEVTVILLGSLEDMVEISEEHQVPAVGSCFEELAEVKYFLFSKNRSQQSQISGC
jgi:son of sevenless